MNLMYVDESGDPGYREDGKPYRLGNGPSPFFIRVGVIICESDWMRVVRRLREFRLKHALTRHDEIHASAIWAGREMPWARWHTSNRKALLADYLSLVGSCPEVSLLAVIIDKKNVRARHRRGLESERIRNPKLRSLELLAERFTSVLRTRGITERGLMILDSVEVADDQMHRGFQEYLYRASRNVREDRFIESCLAEPSESSEFLQMADACAYAVSRYMNSEDSLFDIIEKRFVRSKGKVVGIKIWPTPAVPAALPATGS